MTSGAPGAYRSTIAVATGKSLAACARVTATASASAASVSVTATRAASASALPAEVFGPKIHRRVRIRRRRHDVELAKHGFPDHSHLDAGIAGLRLKPFGVGTADAGGIVKP